MEPTPHEKDKLLLFTAGLLAERRKARGHSTILKPSPTCPAPCWKARGRVAVWRS
jgi:hypothetical protein